MSTTLVIVLNVMMSLLAFGVVGAGVLIARRLSPELPNEGGHATWRGPGSGRVERLLVVQRSAASTATATNSSAR